MIIFLSVENFRRHFTDSSGTGKSPAVKEIVIELSGYAKIAQLEIAHLAIENIAFLNIAMNNVLVFTIFQSIARIYSDSKDIVHGNLSCRHELTQICQQFHSNEDCIRILTSDYCIVINHYDIRSSLKLFHNIDLFEDRGDEFISGIPSAYVRIDIARHGDSFLFANDLQCTLRNPPIFFSVDLIYFAKRSGPQQSYYSPLRPCSRKVSLCQPPPVLDHRFH